MCIGSYALVVLPLCRFHPIQESEDQASAVETPVMWLGEAYKSANEIYASFCTLWSLIIDAC